MAAPVIVPLRSKRQRRAVAMQRLNHAIPAVGLLYAGQQAIAGGEGFAFYLGVFEIVSSGILLVLTLREIRSALRGGGHEGHQHHGVDWVDIAAGFVLVAEVLEHWHLTHHLSRPRLLSALTTFALGLFHGRIAGRRARRRVLQVTDAGISIPGRPFKARRLQAQWHELTSIDVADTWAKVTTRGGQVRRLDLSDLLDEGAVRLALLDARSRLQSAADTAE